jgi:epoxide hydrolase-like predicted phosphatase
MSALYNAGHEARRMTGRDDMPIRAVVFDIGGVLEDAPPIGVAEQWEAALGLRPGELKERLGGVWEAGAIGAISEAEVRGSIGRLLRLDEARVHAFMEDIWTEYLGALNTELMGYFRGLRPRYRTAMLSNSFVGAREREQRRYGFGDMTDLIVYSHEVGMAKPDPRIYQLTCDRLRVRPEQMIFLDDRAEFVEPALEAGIRAILYEDNAQALADIEAALNG